MKRTQLLSIVTVIMISIFFGQMASARGLETLGPRMSACKVKKNNAEFFVTATEKTVKLIKGTALSWTIPDLHQGLIVVKAKIGKKWVNGEIHLDDTTCN